MKLIIRVGNRYDPLHSNFMPGWRDGQIIDIRPDDYQEGRMERKHFLVLQTPQDYWALRGSTNWKSDQDKVMDFKKFLVPVDRNGKYPWEFGYLEDEKRIRCRDWFVDIEKLLSDKWITQADHDGIRDFSKEYGSILIDRPLEDYLVHEDVKTRVDPTIHNMAVAAGTFSIGTTAADYATVTAFEADIAATLTGNLTGEHQDEETVISTAVIFDTDTATFLLKLTAVSGAEHDGTAYGNGARIAYGTNDRLEFAETTDDDLANVEISKLAINATGNGNRGVRILNVGGIVTTNRMLVKGDANAVIGIELGGASFSSTTINNIVYGFGNGAGDGGIFIGPPVTAGPTVIVANNTCIKNFNNIVQDRPGAISYDLTLKNNLCQGDTGGSDYRDDGGGFGTTAFNISEDATSPDASYRSKDLHTNTIFFDFANDNYLLNPAGDATNLAIADDGEDLSGIFTDDIIGQTRSTWYIGASEIVAVAAVGGILKRPYDNYSRNLITR